MHLRIAVGLLVLQFCRGAVGVAQTPGVRPVNEVTVAELKNIVASSAGAVVLVNAWATWCKPCKEEMPALLRLNQKYGGKSFRLILVSADDIDDLDSVVKPMLTRLGVDFPTYIVHDTSDEAFITGMDPDWSGALPTSFVYDRQGKLVSRITGERTYAQFEKAIAGVLSDHR